MVNFQGFVEELKKERDTIQRHLEAMNAAITAFAGVYTNGTSPATRTMSPAARKRIATAQRARWAKVRATKGHTTSMVTAKPKRVMSAAARRKIAAAQRARWAKVRSGRKTT
jgi:hypothetical protein